jgi:thymidylate synthase ThyX
MRRPEIVPALLLRLQTASDSQIRQLAAVLLRKRVTRLWQHLPEPSRRDAQRLLLERLAGEHSHAVRRAIADVVGVVAKYAVPRGEWPELLDFLHRCSQSGEAEHREVAFTLFSSLTETIGETVRRFNSQNIIAEAETSLTCMRPYAPCLA